jgi:hypothetical protein
VRTTTVLHRLFFMRGTIYFTDCSPPKRFREKLVLRKDEESRGVSNRREMKSVAGLGVGEMAILFLKVWAVIMFRCYKFEVGLCPSCLERPPYLTSGCSRRFEFGLLADLIRETPRSDLTPFFYWLYFRFQSRDWSFLAFGLLCCFHRHKHFMSFRYPI